MRTRQGGKGGGAVTIDEPSGMPDLSDWTFTVQIWPDDLDGGWVAECIDLPGCMSQGETEQEALDNIRDAIEETLMSLLRDWREATRREAPSQDPERPAHRREVKVALSA